MVSAFSEPLVSSDESLAGEPIRRVRVSWDTLSLLFPTDAKAEFVNLADVRITCVPLKHLGGRFQELQEIPWEHPTDSRSELKLAPLTSSED